MRSRAYLEVTSRNRIAHAALAWRGQSPRTSNQPRRLQFASKSAVSSLATVRERGSFWCMERVVRVYFSHEAAAAADRAADAAMLPQDRLDLALDLAARYREGLGEVADRFERVCRIVALSRG